ncbi:RagB/SusD family nutrient uptake outer membrane protein [Mucilaginibacter sp. PAMB04274]|uniref:RagB/SusD family nutrient uptake outer membrane protein n=1 Tax=Mucilaginibacter sp. PAMB04274 TaxID=3138568 RepID=UPI0031F71231
MIRNKLKYILLVLSSIALVSCKKFLDKQPNDMLNIDQVFTIRLETERYLANVYSYIPDPLICNGTNYTPLSDEADWVFNWPHQQINTGNWSPVSAPFDLWAKYYKGIRAASTFINRVGECAECDQLNPGITAQYREQARVLRAYYYFLLLRQYGPVVILPETPLPIDAPLDEIQMPRNSYDECVDFIVSELDKAEKVLPDNPLNTIDYGRTTAGVARALKSRVLLYAASPQWNGNTDYADFKNKDGKQLINQVFNKEKWVKAAAAAKAVIDKMPGGLYKKNGIDGKFDPLLSYQYLFLDRWNAEVIWARPQTGDVIRYERCASPRQLNGYIGLGPSQQLVDEYEMENGIAPFTAYSTTASPVINPASGYLEAGFSTAATKYAKAGTFNMFVGREPRFYASIGYNGMDWLYKGADGKTITRVELFATGRDGYNGSNDHSTTGYTTTKMVNPESDVKNGKHVLKAWIFFRLGEFYLNYAEALNEADPGNSDIARYVNLVRERAGLPALITGLSQDQMRERIRHERKIELAFEEHRFWDVRRWKIADKTETTPIYGLSVTAGTNFTDVNFYKRTIVETRVFNKKHMLWPLPQSEMDRNNILVQNPGW